MTDPKIPFKSATEEKPGNKKMVLIIGLLFVVIVVLAIFLFKGSPGSGKNASPQMKQMEETVTQIQKLETDIQEKQNEMFSLLVDYNKRTGKEIAEFNILNLTAEQKQVLQEKIKNEKDISVKSLLQDILDKNNDIKELNKKLKELEEILPKPKTVEEGDNHFKLAMDFLMNEKGVDKKKAMDLVERALLFDSLVPGFKVWNFYSDGEFGTFITQGTAPISPNQIQRKVKKTLVDARDKAISERDQLASDIQQLEIRRAELITQLDLLNQEKGNLLGKMEELTVLNEELQTKINSVYFIADTSKKLQEAGILKTGFLRSTKLQGVLPETFKHSIDLRKDKVIKISAVDLQIDKIKSVGFFPKFYINETDYAVTIDETRQNAEIKLLNYKKFRSERIVLAVN